MKKDGRDLQTVKIGEGVARVALSLLQFLHLGVMLHEGTKVEKHVIMKVPDVA